MSSQQRCKFPLHREKRGLSVSGSESAALIQGSACEIARPQGCAYLHLKDDKQGELQKFKVPLRLKQYSSTSSDYGNYRPFHSPGAK